MIQRTILPVVEVTEPCVLHKVENKANVKIDIN